MRESYAEKQVCITGIGQSAVGRPSPHSALRLTLDACLDAIADAGLTPAQVDGITTYPGKTTLGGGISPVSSTEAMMALGMEPSWIGASNEGHAHMGALFQAIMAIASGLCRHVLVFRTVAQATARQTARRSTLLGSGSSAAEGYNQWTLPFGAHSPANIWALYAQGYADAFGLSGEQLGAIAINGRRMAAQNPNAVYRDPISIDDYLTSRLISTPLRLFDCDTHIDGATAILLSHRNVAYDLKNPPLAIEAMGMGISGLGMGLHEGDFTRLPGAERAGTMLWSRTDLSPSDVDVAEIYDGFSILALLWLEAAQLCGRGEAASFVEGGSRIALDGCLPMNTGGGQLSAGRFHGYGHTHEACVQLWGRGGARQVSNVKVGIVTNGGYGYGAILLRCD